MSADGHWPERTRRALWAFRKKGFDLKKVIFVITCYVTIHLPAQKGKESTHVQSGVPRNAAAPPPLETLRESRVSAAGRDRGPCTTPNPTPGCGLTSHHHRRIGGHLPVCVRGHRRVGGGVVEVRPWGEKADKGPEPLPGCSVRTRDPHLDTSVPDGGPRDHAHER